MRFHSNWHAAAGLALALAFLVSAPPALAAKEAPTIPAKDQKALEGALDKVLRLLPAPAKEFRHDREGDSREVAATAPPKTADGAWRVPAGAQAGRVYVKRDGTGDDAVETRVEVNVYLNLETTLSDPLGSAGGSLRVDLKDEAPFARHSLAGIDATRVALPLTEEEKANSLTVVRAYIAAPEADGYLADVIQGRRPDRSPWDGTQAKSASEVRTIVVEFHGPASEVERLAAATPVLKLRALLTP
ncbi:MAG TPA: hypothetical protein VLT84_01905 [Acidobacteriota bacterium]|nr:hypothetical protein [Acidobacteriota bacterium]